MYFILAKPLNSKLLNFLEIFNKAATVVLFCIVTYLSKEGQYLSERNLLNVGYVNLSLILAVVAVNLVVLVIKAIVALH